MQNLRRPMGSEHCIYSGSKMSSHVDAIGTCNLVSSRGFILCLENVFCVLSFDKNSISILQFAPLGVSFNFMEYSFTLLNKSKVVDFCERCDGLYSINFTIYYRQVFSYTYYTSLAIHNRRVYPCTS